MQLRAYRDVRGRMEHAKNQEDVPKHALVGTWTEVQAVKQAQLVDEMRAHLKEECS